MKQLSDSPLRHCYFTDCRWRATILLAICFLFGGEFGAYAQTTRSDELRQNISEREQEIRKLEDEISSYQRQLTVLGDEKKTLQNAIKTLDVTRIKLSKDIQLTEKKIVRANGEISGLSRQITEQERRIGNNREAISRIIRTIDAASQESMVEILLAKATLADFLRDSDELSKLQEGISDNLVALARSRSELDRTRRSFEEERKSLAKLNIQLGDQKTLADQEKKEQASLLGQTQREESNYKKLLEQKLARKKQFEKEISDFEAQIRAEIDPTSYPPAGTKVLSFPLEQVVITQKFGKTVEAKRLYLSGTHNGVDFRASIGTPVIAAADGTVVGVGDTDTACRWASYGKWALIRHPNGLSTLYAHLSLNKVSEGQSISRGDLVGYSGQTGYSTGPHLHFTTLVSSATSIENIPSKSCPGAIFRIPAAPPNAYLDPESYL